ncbi:hypothetical protein [Caenimonas soli]|uniref:hypothetical protein n=1 Tax=Caenimonas soli TaxID=2735555 RepID=UPI0015558056|nr:hypothetical protein [Caenimonas soli]NPC59349.1 hypothetical protein [Caenimonas soli]
MRFLLSVWAQVAEARGHTAVTVAAVHSTGTRMHTAGKRLLGLFFSAVLLLTPATGYCNLGIGEWGYWTDVDQMTGKPIRQAGVASLTVLKLNPPYTGETYGFLTVRQRVGESPDVFVQVSQGQIPCSTQVGGCTVTVRFDDEQPVRFIAGNPDDGSSQAFFFSNPRVFIARAVKAKRILIQFTMYQSGNRILEFLAPTSLQWELSQPKKER